MTEKVYSTQRVKNLGGRKIENPIHFSRVDESVKVVYIQEGYPDINSAYARAGASVKTLKELPGQAAPAPAPAEKKDK